MTFDDAVLRMDNIAKGRFYSVSYQFTKYASGRLEAECGVYLEGMGWRHAPTWNTVLDLMETKSILGEGPGEEVGEKGGRDVS